MAQLSKAAVAIPRDALRHGQSVRYKGQTWQVLVKAPGKGHWWLQRYDSAGKCHQANAHRDDFEPVR